MTTHVTNRDLTMILLISMFTIFIILFIVGKWLNFHLFSSFLNWIRNRKTSTIISAREQYTQDPMASCIDLSTINEPLKTTNDSSLWTPAFGSISSLVTDGTIYDDTLMPNSNSAYDIVSYANNIQSTLKRTILCDSDDESIVTSLNDLYVTEETIGSGKLQITINYNALEEYLEILFIQVRHLSITKGSKDNLRLFISAYLDHDRKQTQQTQLITYDKSQPVLFNSSMKWKVDDDRLPCTVLHTTLYLQHENNSETIIGECSFTIGEIYIYQPLTTWLNFHDSNEAFWYRGEISISLCYHPTADRLTCSLIQARNLTFYKRDSIITDMISTECYATISLLHRHQVIKKTRTSYHHATDKNPVFNETSVFNVSSNDLLTSYIRIVIYEIIPSPLTTTTKTFEIGHCLIGNHDRTQHMSHWQQMLRVLRRPVIVWHPLKL
ncbi:unnamed protein product [Adineta steineri]|uniref:C2 domain-containing protein n=1 Tax=Adineta steineri TaxID=433720 RepID=A0A814SR19_9BILA|nr:unnamed protein product [Adineta steineri]CAF1039101.1 unnamed protein product [Adineta steineri]CAF1098457.1 unnamed protein product [Adineta steineri]CAF1142038.1 unnamed protein product [Adineta steineri]CAF1149353.1 unnamed protein product [Adineta steineri]